MSELNEPVQVPLKTSVVIIGGGIIGASTAYYLTKKGIPNVLCEKGEVSAEQSSRNWGWCRTIGRAYCEIPLSQLSLQVWEDLGQELSADTGFRRRGVMYVSSTSKQLEQDLTWLEGVKDHELNIRLLSSRELKAYLPETSQPWKGAIYAPEDGRAEPELATRAIVNQASRNGSVIVEQCAVRSIETTGGKASGVITEKGEIQCDTVLLAGGAWSRLFLGNLGIDFPQLRVLASALRTSPLHGGPAISTKTPKFSFAPRLDGGYTVATAGATISQITPDSFRQFSKFFPSFRDNWRILRLRLDTSFLDELRTPRKWKADSTCPFENMRILDPSPSRKILRNTMRDLCAAFPLFKSVSVVSTWGGMIDVTPDASPIMGPLPHIQNLYVATGFSGHGFGIGPGVGKVMAEVISGREPPIALDPFSYSRFYKS